MSLLRVLASGVDGLEVTARGVARAEVWDLLERAKQEAQEAGEPMPFAFPRVDRRFLILPHGRRGWQYWLTSPDFELGLGRNRQRVPAYAQLHSAFLHERGPEMAVGLVGTLLQVDVMDKRFQLIGSRVDIYADVQGWELELTDLERFASHGRFREVFPVAEGSTTVFMAGRRVTGFRFGRDAVVARVYDKTAEIRKHGQSWLPDLWGERDEAAPVWRVEFQLRRRAIAEFGVTEFDEVLASVQDMWDQCAGEWLTLRVRRKNRQRARWPLDPSWAEVQAVEIAPTRTGVIRRRLAEANEEMTVRGLQGYLTSWAAIRGYEELGTVLRALGPRVGRYLKDLDRTFRDEVRRKRARMLLVTDEEDGEPEAQVEESLPRIGRSARTARRARAGQSTFLGRPPRTPRAGSRTRDGSISAGPEIVGESEGGLMEAPSSGEAVNRRGDRSRGAAGRSRAGRRRRTEREDRLPGEGGRAHERGSEVHGPGRGDDGGRARASVGAESPTEPEGSERNHKGAGARPASVDGDER
jgi:hypothetical protein